MPAALWAGATCYLFSDFLLHEFTQLRGGLAIAFFLLSLIALDRNRTRYFLTATGIGLLIHSSALLGLAAWPLSRPKRGRLDALLLITLFSVALARTAGAFSLENLAAPLSAIDARLALYVQLASSGITEAAQPVSVRTGLIFLLILSSYAALRRRDKHASNVASSSSHAGLMLTMLRLIVMGQIALFLFADVKEAAVRIMEFWMACLPLYAAMLAQTPGMRLPRAMLWLWLAATFANFVFRTPSLVAPYALGL